LFIKSTKVRDINGFQNQLIEAIYTVIVEMLTQRSWLSSGCFRV